MPTVRLHFSPRADYGIGSVLRDVVGLRWATAAEKIVCWGRRYHRVDLSFAPGPDVLALAPGDLPPGADATCRVVVGAGPALERYVVGVRATASGVSASYVVPPGDVFDLELDPPAYKAIIAFLVQQRGVAYALHYTDVFLAPEPPSGFRWFCVQLVVAALQRGDVLAGYNPSALTADELMGLLYIHHPKTTNTRRRPDSRNLLPI